MPLYALVYDTVPDYLARRPQFRAEHLAAAERAHREGKLLLAGAFDPPDAALLVFRGDGPEGAEAFARADPYVRNGLVASWRVREWKVVLGALG
ncbi:YciI-like protein [Anaeromyxobacter terrae]|uniref:YciI-like protein n=1 Tax=Anaeromyxobacter terrae TaxID=2925406 RepID=UPI001F58CFF8|nr:YciI-like protein [Anaeromyxobacter sp. SG22]